ncbi:MAG: hypothetical protein NTW87_03470 [Planctomycetota bacterium]|nr:hypothetical protein [Planctomycetota bacterium]
MLPSQGAILTVATALYLLAAPFREPWSVTLCIVSGAFALVLAVAAPFLSHWAVAKRPSAAETGKTE